MKNKKLLNFYMLSIALLSFISFLLPIRQIDEASNSGVGITIVYYVLNAIMCLSLVLIIVIALINLFRDNYEMLNLMKALSLVAFLMVLIVLFVFATQLNRALDWGYLLIAFEVFVLYSFVPIIKMVYAFGEISTYIKRAFPKNVEVPKEEKVEMAEVKEKPKTVKKEKPQPVEVEEVKINDTKTESTQVNDPTTGEK